MRRLILAIFIMLMGATAMQLASPSMAAAEPNNNVGCNANRFFLGFPRWYEYLETEQITDDATDEVSCQPKLNNLSQIWLVVAAVIEMLLRVAALVAVAFVVVAGISYATSQGDPEKTKHSLQTVINALIGLTIAIVATALVTFIAGRFKYEDPNNSDTQQTSESRGPR